MMCVFGSRHDDTNQGNESDSAIEILAKRYVRGEISKEQYEDGIRTLDGGK